MKWKRIGKSLHLTVTDCTCNVCQSVQENEYVVKVTGKNGIYCIKQKREDVNLVYSPKENTKDFE